jgi:K+-sensing histidine kinase KdpD
VTTAGFLELLLAGASRDELEAAVTDAEAAGASTDELAAIRHEHELALQVHEQMARQRSREAELSALYDTAHDLTAIRDLDGILAAIVRRARQLCTPT